MHMRCLILSLFFWCRRRSLARKVLIITSSRSAGRPAGVRQRAKSGVLSNVQTRLILDGSCMVCGLKTTHPGRATAKVGMLHPAGV